jgi:hypothetical protein
LWAPAVFPTASDKLGNLSCRFHQVIVERFSGRRSLLGQLNFNAAAPPVSAAFLLPHWQAPPEARSV